LSHILLVVVVEIDDIALLVTVETGRDPSPQFVFIAYYYLYGDSFSYDIIDPPYDITDPPQTL